jgi:cytochrome c551/c552
VALAEAMWNHAEGMRDEFTRRRYSWPALDAQELTDIYVYLRKHPSVPMTQSSFEMSSSEGGEALMKEKGCLKCHRNAQSLEPGPRGNTINDLAAALWNHGPRITDQAVSFRPGEMGTLLSYIWARHLFETQGDVGRGKKVFRDRSCAACHAGGQAPRLSGEFDILRITSALWNHGPAMLQQMKSRGIPWPQFNDKDMADLVSYLNSTR